MRFIIVKAAFRLAHDTKKKKEKKKKKRKRKKEKRKKKRKIPKHLDLKQAS